MATKVAGRLGLIYVSGHEVTYGNAWELAVDQAAVGGAHFAQSWMDNEAGILSWSGSVTSWHDKDANYLYDMATAGTSVSLLIYPKRTDLTTYWSGSAIFSGFRSSGDVGGLVTETGDFTGAGSLTATGFA